MQCTTPPPLNGPLLVTEKEAARLICISPSALIASRFRKQPIMPFLRVGSRAIRYRLSDIHDFIERSVRPSKS